MSHEGLGMQNSSSSIVVPSSVDLSAMFNPESAERPWDAGWEKSEMSGVETRDISDYRGILR